MNHQKILIVDDDLSSLQTTTKTLNDATLPFVIADDNAAAMQVVEGDAAITLVIARGFGKDIAGTELCRKIRAVKPHADLPVMVILREDELAKGAEALLAGASDLLIDPFEPRELRIRAQIIPADKVNRVDQPHTQAVENPGAAVEPDLFVPTFDPKMNRFTFGEFEGRQQQWEDDPDTTKIALDKICVCPECEAVPTFRPGCGACGSAWTEREVLIHHYACAHVGPESEFLTDSGLVCPKCRLRDLVAGSDFEQTKGCLRCSDCDAIFAETKMIGHCLSCQHRFPADEGKLMSIYGYRVGRSPDSTIIAAPNYNSSRINAGRTTPSGG